ncbi:MOG interacting and ectopic P-granules protein 1 [Drosophila eugracilis]|uniref:MOG interacting and ectopic P-granules protein 1 n=1 Tax=Drosophila eugracilis TaxID=29029 RepID=UPI0007E61C0E|nr:MOG interacting and ectopic P-granules protein 1 [Drosophila eugracilis]
MTEVDVVLPEGVAEPTTKLASASNSPKQSKTSADDDEQRVRTEDEEEQQEEEHLTEAPSKEKLELLSTGDKDIAKEDVAQASPQAPAPEEIMEVDDNEEVVENEVENDDEDSQITSTSSKEHKLGEEDEEEEATTNGDGDHEPEDEDDAEKIGSTAENSCEAEDPLGAATVQGEELVSRKKSQLDADESMASELEDDEPTAKQENGFAASPKQKENGQASLAETKAAVASSDSAVVNLDEDSDEEMEEITEHKEADKPTEQAAKPASCSGGDSSDDAVLIASDSETESPAPPPPVKKLPPVVKATPPPPPVQEDEDDDDDDDCVVIEDDTPPSISPSSKRKSDLDELQQPSHKRQRSSTPSGMGQLTIKDARSLMPLDGSPSSVPGPRDSVYPVTITNAVTGAATNLGVVPPKLVPMAGGITASPVQLNPPTLSLTGLPSMTNNANLLPGLTDDMFVLEAPSFIVPYIYEKPPHENICEVVKAIETKYALSAEDLAEADKGDEFDMMTEQNKEDKPADQADDGGKKKKKKRGDDESWSEQSDDDDDEDDDDDSESGMRTKVLIKEANDDLSALKVAIKPAAALATAGGVSANNPGGSKPGQENYFESPLGKFFMDIGVGLVQEYVQADLLRLQKRKMRKAQVQNPKEFEMAINALSGNLQASKTKNAPFKFRMKRCEFCNFKSESAMAMANHYETPHMNGVLYKCNFCTFEIRNATEIVYHMEAVHNIKARLIKPLPYHQCPNCGFEDNGKAKLARHQPVCAKKFRPELNLAPPNDWEAPAKIPRIKPRHGLVGTATAYQAMAAQAAAQKAALANIQQQQAAAQARNNLQAAALAAQNAAKMRQRAPQPPKQNMVRNPAPVRGGNSMNASLSLPNSYQLAAGQLVQASKKPMAGQPSISITPLPRQSSVGAGAGASSSKAPQAAAGMKPGQSPSGNNKAQFVICEICDGYIKDLEQLRNHMQWMHKVKIHPKMIYNRPPLNCQKCQFRFFTDQGLERHLLGSHGLVTSSMQEAANKGKDAGRCPVCGRMYQWKLLNHVSRDHHMTLKPAHLSYKCTVCTATFGMYKQFETHVYTAHSTVARKAMDSKKNSAQSSGSGSGAGMSRSSLGAANDSLLKPLKINDEITIIPQPASKPRITNMESHVID